MKTSDIDRIHAAGLITPEQRRAIIEHFELDQERNRLLQVLAILGGLLVSAGVILMIASNWDAIPTLVRLAAGWLLMLAVHAAGWKVSRAGRHPAVGASLHLIGSMMFLGNIALVGQAYNLSSRFPDAIILWFAGIAPLAWILRSKAQWILSMAAFGVWMAAEMGESRSWFYFGSEVRQMLFFAMLGIGIYGGGAWLRRSVYPEFGEPTEKFGLLTLHIASFPLDIAFFYSSRTVETGGWVLCGLATVVAVGLIAAGLSRHTELSDRQWRWTWGLVLTGLIGLSWVGLTVKLDDSWRPSAHLVGPHWVSIPVLFGFCLIQAQVGILTRSAFLLNLAITFVGLHVVAAYLQLFGSMLDTGLVFLVGGVLLISLAIFLERKRRKLLHRIREPAAGTAPDAGSNPEAP